MGITEELPTTKEECNCEEKDNSFLDYKGDKTSCSCWRLPHTEIPKRHRHACIARLDKKESRNVIKKLIRDGNPNTYVYGQVGIGKTYFACALLKHAIFEYKLQGLYTYFYKITKEIKRSFNLKARPKLLKRIEKSDIIVLDDVGLRKMSDFESEVLFDIVNAIYDNHKHMIMVSNYKLDKLIKMLSKGLNQRIIHRIVNMCYPYKPPQEDMRKIHD